MTTPSSLTENDACPLDSRRTSRETLVKLFVADLSFLASLGHLLVFRNEDRLFRFIVFFFCPLASVWNLVGPCICVAAQFLVSGGNVAVTKEAMRICFGRTADRPTPQRDVEEALARPKTRRRRPIARSAMLLAALAQSIAALHLFRRRVQYRAVLGVDIKVFQLAVGTLATTVLNLVHLVYDPVCEAHTSYRWWTLFTTTRSAYSDLVVALTLSFCLPVLYSKVSDPEIGPFTQLLVVTKAIPGWVYPVGGGWFFGGLFVYSLLEAFLDSTPSVRQVFLKLWILPTCAWLALLVVILVAWLPLGAEVAEYVVILFTYGDVRGLERLPTDVPCPSAWGDPQADYIWAFG